MHSLRVELLLRIISEGVTSPNRLSQAVDINLNLVAYHVRILHDYGAIELVNTKRRRGASEHFYSAVPESEVLMLLLGQRMSVATQSAPGDFVGNLLALKKGGKVPIATALPVLVDSQGVKELQEAASQLMETFRSVEEASKARAAARKTKSTFLTVGVLAFPLQGNPST